MKSSAVAIFTLCSFAFPSVCFAHSGTLFRTTMTIIPFLAPMIAVGISAIRNYFHNKK